MNNYSKGRHIVPSARKSIHAYKHPHSVSFLNMGDHGNINNKNRRESHETSQPARYEEPSEKGMDEVDNILSKLKSRRKIGKGNQNCRRNSYDLNYFQDSSDSDNVLLTKSLPTSLSSYSPCSSYDWDLDGQSKSLNTIGNISNQSVDFEKSQTSNYSLLNQTTNFQSQERSSKDPSNKSVIWAPFVVVIIGVIVIYGKQIIGTKENKGYDASRFYNDIDNLGGRYRLSQDSVLQVQTGIATISQREDAGSFIFVYNSQSLNFNYNLFDDILDSISHTTAKFLRNDSTTVRHVVVESSDLNMRTSSELINKYREDVTRTGVMLIKNIDRIPSSLAMAFHYYCDEYNPLVKKSAIFFTLDLAKCQNNSEASMHYLIEKCLTNKWNSVPPENIKPLLTRVVGIVVDLRQV